MGGRVQRLGITYIENIAKAGGFLRLFFYKTFYVNFRKIIDFFAFFLYICNHTK